MFLSILHIFLKFHFLAPKSDKLKRHVILENQEVIQYSVTSKKDPPTSIEIRPFLDLKVCFFSDFHLI